MDGQGFRCEQGLYQECDFRQFTLQSGKDSSCVPCPCSGHLSEAELKDNRVIYRREEISRQHTTKGGAGSLPSAFSQIYSELKVAQKHVSSSE